MNELHYLYGLENIELYTIDLDIQIPDFCPRITIRDSNFIFPTFTA